jgi:hypothetical protein
MRVIGGDDGTELRRTQRAVAYDLVKPLVFLFILTFGCGALFRGRHVDHPRRRWRLVVAQPVNDVVAIKAAA